MIDMGAINTRNSIHIITIVAFIANIDVTSRDAFTFKESYNTFAVEMVESHSEEEVMAAITTAYIVNIDDAPFIINYIRVAITVNSKASSSSSIASHIIETVVDIMKAFNFRTHFPPLINYNEK